MPVLRSLPGRFLLYIESRNSKADPYSGLIHMTAVCENSTQSVKDYQLTPTPAGAIQLSYQPHGPVNPDPAQISLWGTICLRDPSGGTTCKRFHNWSPIFGASDVATGVALPVLTLSSHTSLFSIHLKRNFAPVLLSPAQGIGWNAPNDYLAQLPAPVVNPPSAPVAPAPVPNKKVNLPIKHQGDLSMFVAKELLSLAQMRKDMCPITVEEFSAGNTAVMPCGHLFMQIAIEETFKKEPNKCPACRQVGRPTFV